jgi:hypothetical protein
MSERATIHPGVVGQVLHCAKQAIWRLVLFAPEAKVLAGKKSILGLGRRASVISEVAGVGEALNFNGRQRRYHDG